MEVKITTVQPNEAKQSLSVSVSNNINIIYQKDQVLVKLLKQEKTIDYLQKPTNKSEDKTKSIHNLNSLNSYDPDEELNPGVFYRRSIVEENIKPKSILKRKIDGLKNNKIKVYFFQTKQSKTFNMQDLEHDMKVDSFIQYAIQQYCTYFHSFTPSNISTKTLDLKLDDSGSTSGMILDPISHDESISNFINSTLYLIRRSNVSQVIERFELKLKQFEIFDIEMPGSTTQKRNQKLTLQKKPGNTFQTLLSKIFKTCDITENPSYFILIEYYKYKIYSRNQLIQNIPQRKFQLLKARKKTYQDQFLNNFPTVSDANQLQGDNWLIKNIYPTNQPVKKQLSTIIDNGMMKGKMRFSIQNCEFVQNYETTFCSRMIQKFVQYPYEVRYSLLALNDAYQSQQNLVLQFLSKQDHMVKRYPMSKQMRMSFLQQILRLCRIYKKVIQRKYKN